MGRSLDKRERNRIEAMPVGDMGTALGDYNTHTKTHTSFDYKRNANATNTSKRKKGWPRWALIQVGKVDSKKKKSSKQKSKTFCRSELETKCFRLSKVCTDNSRMRGTRLANKTSVEKMLNVLKQYQKIF